MLTQEQLDERLKFVTGSDAAVICGLNKSPSGEFYKTKVQLWLEKTGRAVAEDIGHLNHIKFGNFFEQGVADWFQDATGKIVHKHPAMLVHKSHPWMAGNIDFKVVGENAILECKTAYKPGEEWGDGENVIPPHYLMQVAHYCAVGNFDRAYIAVVFAITREMRWYVYERNTFLEGKLITREKDFWENNVLADVQPPIESAQDILTLYKETNANPIIADKEISHAVSEYDFYSEQIKDLEAMKKRAKEKVQLYMLDADTLVDKSGKILAKWSYIKGATRIDNNILKTEFPDVHAKCLKTGEPQRRFKVEGEKD